MSAFGGKGDMASAPANCLLMTQSGRHGIVDLTLKSAALLYIHAHTSLLFDGATTDLAI
jgi:hypothetical protein